MKVLPVCLILDACGDRHTTLLRLDLEHLLAAVEPGAIAPPVAWVDIVHVRYGFDEFAHPVGLGAEMLGHRRRSELVIEDVVAGTTLGVDP